jgi:carotenoid cleavage dioxygenase-like enzyme
MTSMVDFAAQATRQGFFAPSRFEADVYDCQVEGQVPRELDGAFLRVGGEWFYPQMYPDDGGFSVDGYISMFRFKNGVVDYKGRWVKTPRWKADHAARRQLFGNYRNPFFDDPSVKGLDRTVANTAVVAHAGKLFALKEDTLPYEIDPRTLETVGPWDFHGKYRSRTFTAHPKFDPATGEMICYGYEATGLLSDDVFVYTVDKAGKVTREVRFKVPYVSMMHDIVLTERHIVFPFGGYVTSMERLKAGKVHWGWDPKAPAMVGILPRDGDGRDIRWFKGPLQATIHAFNGRTEGNKVILEAGIYESNPFPWFHPVDGASAAAVRTRCFLHRQTFDLNSTGDSFEDEIIFPGPASDLGKVDDRYLGQPYRNIFTSYSDPERPFDTARAGNIGRGVTNCYGRFDLAARTITPLFAGPTHSLQESTFVPKKGGAEGEGWLMGVASNYAEMRSELIVADAMSMTELARVILPFRSSAALHGKWAEANELAFA